ncbi:DUF2061 domain-containing protein [Eleftheria terrae]|uniref:DUF2061 domain-containing protein n=1 Tax=Eleftheria terrae TaxID=1597781 RepID=UPI00263ABC5C|nr:DUF2061 domain-containing protein [Eleftheria terrae]WKB51249.1 DUF2061 domain-containing protein [Eleftheria terrae]
MAKTASFGILHLGISFSVGYVLTGSVAISGAMTLIEPLLNTVAHYFFDKYWGHAPLVARLRRWGQALRVGRAAAGPASVPV